MLLTLALLISQAFAYNGSISFSDSEKALHAAKAEVIAQDAAQCLEDHYQDHLSFFKKNGVSRYFGNRRYIKGEVAGRRADGHVLTPIRPELRKHGLNPDLEDQMTSMSCVDFARLCLSTAFSKAGQSDLWARIDAFNTLNQNIGPAIEIGLQALGWKLVYWNPDPSMNAAWDKADEQRTPTNPSNVWGFHQARYNSVMGPKHLYYQYKVDDYSTLVNFGTHVPNRFMSVPFFMGFAHTGYHVFLGSHGKVIEAHSVRDLFSLENMQQNMFNPLAGGAPMSTNTEVYRSGLIAVPPGTL